LKRARLGSPVAALFLAAALLAGVPPLAARAQGESEPAPTNAAPPKASELVKPVPGPAVRLAAGGTAEARITFHVAATWHVNAHKPNEDFLVPTVLTLAAAERVTPGAPAYPKPIQAKLSFSDTPLAVYQDIFWALLNSNEFILNH